jgi:transcription-repair coupling factor (superfamily II helicase)
MELTGITKHLEQTDPLRRLGASAEAATIGVPDGAKAVTIAALARQFGGPIFLLTSRPARAEALVEELPVWLGESIPVLDFPERDPLPYERIAPEPEAVRDRLRALSSLADGGSQVVVACAAAVAQRTLSPDERRAAIHRLRPGQRLDLEEFLGRLVRAGYRMEPLVQESGEVSRRGGIIDVFPPDAEYPVRIELLGREIETLRLFDPLTQRSVRPVEDVELLPARELILAASPDVLREAKTSKCSPEHRERWEEELAQLRQGDVPAGIDLYVPFLARSTVLEHLTKDALVVLDEEADVAGAAQDTLDQAEASRGELEQRGEIPSGLPFPLVDWQSLQAAIDARPRIVRLSRWASEDQPGVLRLPFAPPPAYAGQLRKLTADSARRIDEGGRTVIVSQQADRLAEMFTDEGTPASVVSSLDSEPGGLTIVRGSLAEGWRCGTEGTDLAVITDTEVFGFVKQRRAPPRRALNREAFLADLTPGSYLVHIDHGIARFAGLLQKVVDGHEREYLELHYAEGDKLFVPTDQLDRVSRYIGPSDRMPHPTRLGSGEWQRARERVKKAVQVLARELLTLYAAREVLPGHSYAPDTPWQMEMEAAFPYVETPDQVHAIIAVKQEMESARPMDRLICGDVGYGKTEVAIRAAFKAVMGGRQVAVLVPTTVLAQQHYETFTERLAAFPVTVDVLSRFRSDQEQREIVEKVASGGVDIIIGTHRLLQKDVNFKDLGLLVIDEEQRFGVSHKEHLKKLRREVDVLTLSATPIPRTLYMALGEIRDMSTMETPPEDRLPIKTYVSQYDDHLIREAITRELERGGQVYFVHNRVHNIEMISEKVRDIAPEARVSVGHGQMDEKLLAKAMDDFVHGRSDVLVCTTIIESGLDIPNVNTIIINQADRLGLAQLYQLRGRVGRGAHRAYAYLLYDKTTRLTETARQRLQAIFEATELGAGFQIAMRDLEIRGAGNLLGPEQSGFMAAVGFDLYVRLLAGAVERMRALMRGEPMPPERETTGVSIDLPISAHLPPAYVPDINLRLALYQRLSAASSQQEVGEIGIEMVDRFGPPPPVARNLLYIAALRAVAADAGVQSIIEEDGAAVVRMREEEQVPRDSLEDIVLRGVQLGRSILKIELGDGWRDRLQRTLEQLSTAVATAPASNGRDDHRRR